MASGFVKAVDARGFGFKLEEYFSPSVFDLPVFGRFALPIAVVVIALELLLGTLLLLKIKLRLTLLSLILVCIFFAFLTFYSAYFNAVTDCGCFGDAIKLSPWSSFFKDIGLLAALAVLWFSYRKKFGAFEASRVQFGWLALLSIGFTFVTFYGINHEPLIDFRSYKIGTDMSAEKKKIESNPSVYQTFYTLKNEQTGESRQVGQEDFINNKNYWQEGSPWKIVQGKNISKIVREGYSSEISKFKITDASGNDLTDKILAAPRAVLLFCHDPSIADAKILSRAENKIIAQKAGIALGISTKISTFKLLQNCVMDGTAIKTIARSNPFVLILERGKIMAKILAKTYIKQ